MSREHLSGIEIQLLNTQRCKDKTPISADEARELIGQFIGSGTIAASLSDFNFIQTRLALDQSVRLQESIEKLDGSSTKLTKWLIGLTWVLVAMTAVLIALTVVIIIKGK